MPKSARLIKGNACYPDNEIEQWMTALAEEALKLQRRLADGALKIVARGEKQDGAPAASQAEVLEYTK